MANAPLKAAQLQSRHANLLRKMKAKLFYMFRRQCKKNRKCYSSS